LLCRATEKAAGCILCGDYLDLSSLYRTVALVASGAALTEPIGNMLFAFAYDVRHASYGEKETVDLGREKLDKLQYRGFRRLWPSYLFTLALLRSSAAYVTTTKQDQVNLHQLEASTFDALTAAGADAALCEKWLRHFSPSNEYLTDWVEDADHRYLYERPKGKPRIARLPKILLSLHETSDEYREFEVDVRRAAMREDCRPDQLRGERTWPSFRW
jgi:hypothetical protein